MKWILAILLNALSIVAFSQTTDSIAAPYKRFPTVPAFKITLGDSSTTYTKEDLPKKRPVLLMIFNPECEHCQHETQELLKYKEELKDIEVLMVTFQPLYKMNEFVKDYHVTDLPNVVVGRDPYYLLSSFYQMHSLPYIALYDKKGNLIETAEGSLPLPKLIALFKSKK
ncbi:MAG: TlpA family protein disulfide reductase [Candidatus Dadabacteria bacterium]